MSRLLNRLVIPVGGAVALAGVVWLLAVGAPRAAVPAHRAERALAGIGASSAGCSRACWRARALANRRLYRHEHRRWQLEKAHRLRARAAYERSRARTIQAHVASPATDWRAKQIAAAEILGREGDAAGTDPWPHCADPYDHAGASWDDTVRCENGGSWLDSAGYFRCGLQFDPMWEQRFGRLCP